MTRVNASNVSDLPNDPSSSAPSQQTQLKDPPSPSKVPSPPASHKLGHSRGASADSVSSLSGLKQKTFNQLMGDSSANMVVKTSELDISTYKVPHCPDPDKCTPTSDVRNLVNKDKNFAATSKAGATAGVASIHPSRSTDSLMTRGRAFSDAKSYQEVADTLSPMKIMKSIPTTFSSLSKLLEANKTWASATAKKNPTFFKKLANQQTPQLLWIGCSDSRVPANQIVNLAPGEVFVHRNIANVVVHTDINCLSVIQYAVDVLQVKHIIVCGHYGCGGVLAAMRNKQFGLIDNWLRNIKDVCRRHIDRLDAIEDHKERADLLCELNVANSVGHVCATTIVQNAWSRGQELSVHGWCYRIDDGLIRDLNLCVSGMDAMEKVYWMN